MFRHFPLFVAVTTLIANQDSIALAQEDLSSHGLNSTAATKENQNRSAAASGELSVEEDTTAPTISHTMNPGEKDRSTSRAPTNKQGIQTTKRMVTDLNLKIVHENVKTSAVFPSWIATPVPTLSTRNRDKDESCIFPDYLQTTFCSSYNRQAPGKICKWHHAKEGPSRIFPFQEIAPPYKNWELHFEKSRFYTSRKTYTFNCKKKHEGDKFLVQVSVRSYEQGRRKRKVMYVCLKFIKSGVNVVRYKASQASYKLDQRLCRDERLDSDSSEGIFIADKYREVPYCPGPLNGGWSISRIYDAHNGVHCNNTADEGAAVLESNCLGHEGIHLDFSAFARCSGFNRARDGKYFKRVLHEQLRMRCYSESWVDDESAGLLSSVIVRREETLLPYIHQDPQHRYTNHELFYCLRYKRDPKTSGIRLYFFFDSLCRNISDENRRGPFISLDLVPLRSSAQLQQFFSHFRSMSRVFSDSIQGKWIEKSTRGGRREILVRGSEISFGQEGAFVSLNSYTSRDQHSPAPSPCSGNLWMSKKYKVPFFTQNYVIVSTNARAGCRPRMTGLGINADTSHMTYRLTRGRPLPWKSLFNNSKKRLVFFANEQRRFCETIHLFTIDPYPLWGRNIEKIAVRPYMLSTGGQPYKDCRFEGPLPTWFFGTFAVEITRNLPDYFEIKCRGTIDICKTSGEIRLRGGAPCRPEYLMGCVGAIWSDAKENDQINSRHFLVQDLRTRDIYCAKHGAGFRIVRASTMQCFEFDWGIAAFEQRFTEEIEILEQERYQQCPVILTERPATVLPVVQRRLDTTNHSRDIVRVFTPASRKNTSAMVVTNVDQSTSKSSSSACKAATTMCPLFLLYLGFVAVFK